LILQFGYHCRLQKVVQNKKERGFSTKRVQNPSIMMANCDFSLSSLRERVTSKPIPHQEPPATKDRLDGESATSTMTIIRSSLESEAESPSRTIRDEMK